MESLKVYVKEGESVLQAPKSPIEEPVSPKLCQFSPKTPISACPFGHQLLMLLSLKKHILGEERFHFEVLPINATKPPNEFRQNCLRNLPAIVDPNTETATDHELEIIEYLEKQYPTPALNIPASQGDDETRVSKICSDLMKKFNHFIKNVTKDNSQLLAAVRALNDYFEMKGTQFVFGNTITSFDVELMPKLHQLRIACSLVRSLNIPPNFTGVWRYLFRAYHCPAFVQWAPSDQEIVIAWTTKAASETPSMKLSFDEKKRLIKSEPCFSFSMPTQELTWKFSSTMIQNCEGAMRHFEKCI